MAKSAAVWGIDIGRCALKTLRCHMDGDAIVADGFDYIEYPKLLTQPEADAPQLIKEALEQFLTRNSVKGDKVAISVSGESGLARYFKPPPVDVKKIADIVKYEARQQIPFALEDVIWDYQRMAGGQEVDGFALDTEIGLFAMKREQVTKSLAPFNTANIEVDVIQLAPIAIYNYIAYDVAKELGEGEEYSSENPPPSIVVLSIGTDTTDLVVTNGYRVWQRNIPLGGNHFTKQLSKELKLTFAKAEHLKRNPKQADDPKAIFQAMRPVFADMVTEVQRSVGFFQSLDRKAKIGSVVMLGNTVKLPGLVQYLSKHLGYPIQDIDSFHKLGGASVIAAPSFKDNVLAFGTCYGLCLQALNRGKLSTNLLPREILTQRLIRAKKPWAVAGVSAMVLACALNYICFYRTYETVHPDTADSAGVTWNAAVGKAKEVADYSGKLVGEDAAKDGKLKLLGKIGNEVVGSADRRLLWLEVMRAINTSLPEMAPGLGPQMPTPDPKKLPFKQRKDLKIEYIETQYYQDLTKWYDDSVKNAYLEISKEIDASDPVAAPAGPAPVEGAAPAVAPATAAAPAAAAATPPAAPAATATAPAATPAGATPAAGAPADAPSGAGWVIEIKGYHYYNDPNERGQGGSLHLRNTLIKNLLRGFVEVPIGPGKRNERFSMKELGIGFPILAFSPIPKRVPIPNPNYTPPAGGVGGTGGGFGGASGGFGSGSVSVDAAGAAKPQDPDNPEYYLVDKYDFAVQFVWQETPLNIRLQKRKEQQAAADAAAAAAGNNAAAAPTGATPAAGAAVTPPAAPPAAGVAPAAPPAGEVPAATAPVAVPPAPGAETPNTPAAATPAPPDGPAPPTPAPPGAVPAAPAPGVPESPPPAAAGPAPATPAAPAPAPPAAP